MVDAANKFIRFAQILAVVVGLALVWFLFVTYGKDISVDEFFLPDTPTVHIGNAPLRVEIAKTSAERIQGLSGRESLADGHGMLFVFPEADYHAMWMKDMNFPIDIIWVSEELIVVSVNNNVTPDSYPRTFRPKEPAKYAIEVNTLHVETFGVREGMSVKIPERYLEEE